MAYVEGGCSQVRMSQLITPDTGSPGSQGDTGGGEDTAGPCEPSGQVGGEVGIPPWRQFVGPEVLTA